MKRRKIKLRSKWPDDVTQPSTMRKITADELIDFHFILKDLSTSDIMSLMIQQTVEKTTKS